ncbi:NPCBM/NEW2 domain-containing protein [Clostridium peptidivorans]|uniref:NPCBM/NEW2 domain-containing protein n=1 Tax=Clostridium peptidivorans TaxID=100174 RepID=UPI000BE3F41A|nr:NPCBM/NEW2 domain-containing protein [Clostridium peptidivorans]
MKVTGNSKSQQVDVSVKSVNELKLIIENAGDGISCDHADWADAKLSPCLSDNEKTNLMDFNWISATTGWKTIQKSKNIDNNQITLDGKVYATGIGTHANSEIVYNLNGQFSGFECVAGLDDETSEFGSVIFKVYDDDKLLFQNDKLMTKKIHNSDNSRNIITI